MRILDDTVHQSPPIEKKREGKKKHRKSTKGKQVRLSNRHYITLDSILIINHIISLTEGIKKHESLEAIWNSSFEFSSPIHIHR